MSSSQWAQFPHGGSGPPVWSTGSGKTQLLYTHANPSVEETGTNLLVPSSGGGLPRGSSAGVLQTLMTIVNYESNTTGKFFYGGLSVMQQFEQLLSFTAGVYIPDQTISAASFRLYRVLYSSGSPIFTELLDSVPYSDIFPAGVTFGQTIGLELTFTVDSVQLNSFFASLKATLQTDFTGLIPVVSALYNDIGVYTPVAEGLFLSHFSHESHVEFDDTSLDSLS